MTTKEKKENIIISLCFIIIPILLSIGITTAIGVGYFILKFFGVPI